MTFGRAVLLAAAFAISGVLMLYPYALGQTMGPAAHSALPILMLGVSAAFVAGIGYTPSHRAFRIVLGPAAAWLLMAVGIIILIAARLL
jgi:predicted membrane protein